MDSEIQDFPQPLTQRQALCDRIVPRAEGAGQIDQAIDLQYRLLRLFDPMLYTAQFPDGFRAALSLRGLQPGVGRQPQSDLQQAEFANMTRDMHCLMAGEGYTDEPVGGCPAGDAIDPAQVKRSSRASWAS